MLSMHLGMDDRVVVDREQSLLFLCRRSKDTDTAQLFYNSPRAFQEFILRYGVAFSWLS